MMVGGESGKVRCMYSKRLSLGRIGPEGNTMLGLVRHDVAVSPALFGTISLQVMAGVGALVQSKVADVTTTNLPSDHGRHTHVVISPLRSFKEHRLVVIVDRRKASSYDLRETPTLYDQRVEHDLKGGAAITVRGGNGDTPFSRDEPVHHECEGFVKATGIRIPHPTDGATGARLLAVQEVSRRSLNTNGEGVLVSELASLLELSGMNDD